MTGSKTASRYSLEVYFFQNIFLVPPPSAAVFFCDRTDFSVTEKLKMSVNTTQDIREMPRRCCASHMNLMATFYNHIFISNASFQVFFCDMSQENRFIEIRTEMLWIINIVWNSWIPMCNSGRKSQSCQQMVVQVLFCDISSIFLWHFRVFSCDMSQENPELSKTKKLKW